MEKINPQDISPQEIEEGAEGGNAIDDAIEFDVAILDRHVYSITEAAELASCQRSTIYRVAHTGALKLRKMGRKTVILRSDLLDWLNNLPIAYFDKSKIDRPEGSVICRPGEPMDGQE